MYLPGFTQEDRVLFEYTLVRSHVIRIGVQLLTLDMEPAPYISNISKYLIDGQITVSAGADVSTRSMSGTFLDPKSDFRLDTGSPDDGILYADRILRITYEIFIPQSTRIDKWYAIPIFTGPINKFDRTGGVLSIECIGKESLAGLVWVTYSIPTGTNKIEAIKKILRYGGENFFGDMGTTTAVTTAVITGVAAPKPANTSSTSTTNVPEQTVMWSQAEDIAQGLNRTLYYDGMGYVNMRAFPTASSFTFTDGPNGHVLGEPQITFDPAMLKNVVRIDGKAPTSGTAPTATATAPAAHPLSPQSLGRKVDGVLVPRYLPEITQSDNYTTAAACQTAANSSLQERLDQSIELNFDTLVIPHIEMNDWCTLATSNPDINTSFRLRNFSIPLNSSGKMTVGYTKNQIIDRPAIRNRSTF